MACQQTDSCSETQTGGTEEQPIPVVGEQIDASFESLEAAMFRIAREYEFSQWDGNAGESFRESLAGRLYIAASINWYEDSKSFTQIGSAPRFDGRLWSLTTCKHSMRSSGTFSDHFEECDSDMNLEGDVYQPKRPFFVLTVASKEDFDEQYLVSVALVTRAFERMCDYYEYLCSDEVSADAKESRVVGMDENGKARQELGDCLVDDEGTEIRPPLGHWHGEACEELDSECSSDTSRQPNCSSTASDCEPESAEKVLDADELYPDSPEDHGDLNPESLKCVATSGAWISFTDTETSPLTTRDTVCQGHRNLDTFGDVESILERN